MSGRSKHDFQLSNIQDADTGQTRARAYGDLQDESVKYLNGGKQSPDLSQWPGAQINKLYPTMHTNLFL